MFKKVISLLLLLSLLPFSAARASAINGTIDLNNSYAWGNNLGWINFAPHNGINYVGLNINDSVISGYAWSRQYGWINFAPDNGGVTNNCVGELGGYAWSSQLGWLSLSGAGINNNGLFIGIAGSNNEKSGQINFVCDHCSVKTDWRPCAARPAICGNGIIESGESCDNGVNNGACPKTCSINCQTSSCNGSGGGGGGGGTIFNPPATSTIPVNASTTASSSLATSTIQLSTWFINEVKRTDIVRDGKIDVLDFNSLMVNWGRNNLNNRADVNQDRIVDIFDFNLLMIHWGKIEPR